MHSAVSGTAAEVGAADNVRRPSGRRQIMKAFIFVSERLDNYTAVAVIIMITVFILSVQYYLKVVYVDVGPVSR